MNIQNYLPHRYPFLLIDKIIDIKKGEMITAQKNVSNNEISFICFILVFFFTKSYLQSTQLIRKGKKSMNPEDLSIEESKSYVCPLRDNELSFVSFKGTL